MPYLAMKIDLIGSRKAADRQKLQERLFRSVEEANAKFTPAIAAKFTVTHGDEVQGLLYSNEAHIAIALCEHFVDTLAPQKVRFGLGLGELATELQPYAIGMDGEAWYKAHDAIETAHRKRKHFVLKAAAPTPKIDAMADYMLTHRSYWTANQRQAVRLLEKFGTQQQVASELQISRAAVSKRLAGCLWDQYAALRSVAVDYIKQLTASPTPPTEEH